MDNGPLVHIPGKRDDLSYRNDLASAIGIFLRRSNSVDQTSQFFDYLETVTEEMRAQHKNLPPLDRIVPAHAYEIPPAAGTWSEIAVLLWENGKPVLENINMVVGAAQGIRWVITRVREWKTSSHNESVERLRESGAPIVVPDEEFRFFLSQGAVLVLVVANLVEKYGYQEDLEITSYPRGIRGYNDPAHPNGSINYNVECRFASRNIVYVVNSCAIVLEHFEVRDSRILALPIPDLQDNDGLGISSEVGDHGLKFRSLKR